MAHKSLALKMAARKEQPATDKKSTKSAVTISSLPNSASADNLLHLLNSNIKQTSSNIGNFVDTEMKMVDLTKNGDANQASNYQYKKRKSLISIDENECLQNTFSSKEINLKCDLALGIDQRVDKVYTIGCVDLFHHGHVQLIKRMRQFGKKVIVGVHDSRR
jgi:hypothetical protein